MAAVLATTVLCFVVFVLRVGLIYDAGVQVKM